MKVVRGFLSGHQDTSRSREYLSGFCFVTLDPKTLNSTLKKERNRNCLLLLGIQKLVFSVGTQPFHFLTSQCPFQRSQPRPRPSPSPAPSHFPTPAQPPPTQPPSPQPPAQSQPSASPAQPQTQNMVAKNKLSTFGQNFSSKLIGTQTLNNFYQPYINPKP